MSGAAQHLQRRILVRQALVGVAAFLVVAIFAPRLLMLEDDVVDFVFSVGATLAALALTSTAIMSAATLRRHNTVVRAIAAGEVDVAPDDLRHLDGLPASLALRFFIMSTAISSLVLVPGIRPTMLDGGRAVSLLILTITILGGAAIPQYVLTRQATLDVIELSPLEPLTVLLEVLDLSRVPRKRVTWRLLLAVLAPVALMGAGAVLVTHAHLRTMTEDSRRATALLITRAALEPSISTAKDRAAAAVAASEFGFFVRIVPQDAESTVPTFTREPDGAMVMTAPLDEGQAVLRFSADLNPGTITGSIAVGLVAVLVAAALGVLFGRTLADDLVEATRSVRLLGTENVLRGVTQIARPARFAVVADLGRAIEELTQRFRVFAAAQERALDAREAAQRMRGLLFASVSHDLKSPLNAILGFAELVGRDTLTSAQRESLALISNRGRELLGLIETILDAARVEAGQLNLSPRLTTVSRLITKAVLKAHELTSDIDAHVAVEVADNLPSIQVDPAYAPRALGVIVAHGIRTASGRQLEAVTRVRAAFPSQPGDRVRIDVEFGNHDVTPDELEMLFARQAKGRGRGLTLGLSLSRSTIELHGGAVEVEGAVGGGAICHIFLPLVVPPTRPTISSFPTLG